MVAGQLNSTTVITFNHPFTLGLVIILQSVGFNNKQRYLFSFIFISIFIG